MMPFLYLARFTMLVTALFAFAENRASQIGVWLAVGGIALTVRLAFARRNGRIYRPPSLDLLPSARIAVLAALAALAASRHAGQPTNPDPAQDPIAFPLLITSGVFLATAIYQTVRLLTAAVHNQLHAPNRRPVSTFAVTASVAVIAATATIPLIPQVAQPGLAAVTITALGIGLIARLARPAADRYQARMTDPRNMKKVTIITVAVLAILTLGMYSISPRNRRE